MQDIPIPVVHLFPVLESKLVELLRTLTVDDWDKPTVARQWTVRDVAAHLLDTSMRTVSMYRDGYFLEPDIAIDSFGSLVGYLNHLNASWVEASRRLSPRVITDLIETYSALYQEQLEQLDPFGPALFAVSWAGEAQSANWFHIAREYTERWHHQQQIRDAVGIPGIMTRELYYPVLDTFLQALPHAFRNTEAAAGTTVEVKITGVAGGSWWLQKKDRWALSAQPNGKAQALFEIAGDIAWKLFTKSWRKPESAPFVRTSGSEALLAPVWEMIAVMA